MLFLPFIDMTADNQAFADRSPEIGRSEVCGTHGEFMSTDSDACMLQENKTDDLCIAKDCIESHATHQ